MWYFHHTVIREKSLGENCGNEQEEQFTRPLYFYPAYLIFRMKHDVLNLMRSINMSHNNFVNT